MKELIISESDFTSEHPTEPGLYLWKSDSRYTESNSGIDISSIWVCVYPAKDEYGLHWESYLGVPRLNGRNVKNLGGRFLKIKIDHNN